MLLVTLFSMTDLAMYGSVRVWGGISMEEQTDLYRLDRPYTGRVSPGFLLVHHNAQLHVVRIQNTSGALLHHAASHTVQDLSDAQFQIWEVKPAVVFLGAYTNVVRHTYKHAKAMKKLLSSSLNCYKAFG